MPPLHRHQLAYLTPAGWAAVLARPWDAAARECLAHWAHHHLPLVLTRQADTSAEPDTVSLGLAAPACWQRRRIALQVTPAHIAWFDEFPRGASVLPVLPRSVRPRARALFAALSDCGAPARVYGSYGWQRLSGLDHAHALSDLDLLIGVDDAAQADAVARRLEACRMGRVRVDGELMFGDGAAVAWREWLAWRSGGTRSVLVKRLHGAALLREPQASGLPAAMPLAA